ncbi:MAG: HAD hydrolase-like protein [Pseudomonadota bacterium]
MYQSKKRLIILDADGTTIDAYSAIENAFVHHGLTLGDEASFQKRHHLLKYLGGLKEFPSIVKQNIRQQGRKKIVDTLTDVYRSEASLYPGIAKLMRALIADPDTLVGVVTRNITNEPLETLRQLFHRHDIDVDALDFFDHVPLKERKTTQFRLTRERFVVNPARSYVCGDEYKDFQAAINTGMHPFMVSYGFEDHDRLTQKFDVPDEVISRTPGELCARVRNAFDMPV